MPSLKLHFLGPPRLERDGQLLKMDTRKAIAMLAYLALSGGDTSQPGERQSRDSLAAFLWPEYDDRRGKAALRRTLSTLKAGTGESALDITRVAIGLRTGSYWCDVLQFQAHIQAGEWEAAVTLYRDDFLSGFSLRDSIPFDDWQVMQTEALRRDMVEALEILSRQQQDTGDFPKAINTGHRWLNMDPLREDAHRQLMLLYAQSGQRNKALKQFRDCVRVLDAELGVTPLPETIALHDAIRNNQIEVAQGPSSHRMNSAAKHYSQYSQPSSIVVRQSSISTPILIGRQAELQQMQLVYQQTGPDGRLLTIAGETGIGKTRLAEAFLDGRGDGTLLFSRCYEGENNLAYAPIIQILHDGLRQLPEDADFSHIPAYALVEAGRLLPEIHRINPAANSGAADTHHSPLDAPGAQNRFYEGIGQVLAAMLEGAKLGVLWLDDAHWLDAASLELLLYLLRRWRGRPYLILLCWRSEFLPAEHPLYRLLADLRRDGVSEHIKLTRFTPNEVHQLLKTSIPDFSPDLPMKLFQESEGLPYFVVEYLNALIQQNTLNGTEQTWEIPHTVRDLLAARLVQLGETERQLLQTAAAIGHDFGYDLLHLASGRSDEETVSSLERLVSRGLLLELKTGYDFSHAKLRELTYSDMGLARRRLLHRRIAESLALSNQNRAQTMAILAEIATHFQQAGQDEAASRYFVQAGDQARVLFAHQEGIFYYQSALALGYSEGVPPKKAGKLHEASGDMYVRLGEYTAALSCYETAAAMGEPSQIGHLEHKLGQVYMRQGAWPQAEAQLAMARDSISQPDDLARLYIDWSYVAFNLKEMNQAGTYAALALQTAATPRAQAQGENIAGLLARQAGDYEGAAAHFDRSLALAKAYRLPDTEIAALNNLALALAGGGQTAAALDNFQAALTLCQKVGDRHREAALHNNLADLWHQLGEEEKSMAALKTAVSIYAEIGGRPGDWQPEIWKLTEW